MRLELTGRQVEITPALRRLVDGKLAKLARVLNDSVVSAQAVLTREKYRHRTEITLHARGDNFLHGEGDSGSWEVSIAEAVERLAQQAHKVKGKWQERKRHRTGRRTEEPQVPEPVAPAAPTRSSASRRAAASPRMPRILRTSRQAVKPMALGDAARALDAATDGVVVFRDPETDRVSVLLRRKDGEVLLVQTDI
jgi:putative sigma-54 modulation protein